MIRTAVLGIVLLLSLAAQAGDSDFVRSGKWSGIWASAEGGPEVMPSSFTYKAVKGGDSSGAFEWEETPAWYVPKGLATFVVGPDRVVNGTFDQDEKAEWKIPKLKFPVTGALENNVLSWGWTGQQSGKSYRFEFTFKEDGTVCAARYVGSKKTGHVTMKPTEGG